jgi:acetolactate synthase-1/3 small subunit
MISARGFNIDSLVVGRTDIPDLSRMTLVFFDTQDASEQVLAISLLAV